MEFSTWNLICVILSVYGLKILITMIVIPWYRIKTLARLKRSFGYFFPFIGGFQIFNQNLTKRGDHLWTNQHTREVLPNVRFTAVNIGSTVMITLFDPDLLKTFFNSDQSRYRKFRPFIVQNMALVFGNGLLFSQGNDWKKKRALLVNAFNFDYLKKITPNIKQSITRNIGEIEKFGETMSDGTILLSNLKFTSQIACDVIVGSFFGIDPHNERLNGRSLVEEIKDIIIQVSLQGRSLPYILFGAQFFQLKLTTYQRQLSDRVKNLRAYCLNIIESRIALQRGSKNNNLTKVHKDLMDFMLDGNMIIEKKSGNKEENQYSYDELIDEFCTFMIAGTDTTSHLMSMVLYYLSQNPDCQQTLYNEVQDIDQEKITIDTLQNYNYLFAVIKETQRMYGPVVATFSRESLVDHMIDDIPVKQGMCVIAGLIENGYGNEYFTDPWDFQPERWLSEKVLKDPFSFIPFSAGPRNCIGQHLAILEVKMSIAMLIKRYQISIDKDYTTRMVLNFMYQPETPVKVLLKKRK